MAAIDPFRKLIIYPSLLRSVRSKWDRELWLATMPKQSRQRFNAERARRFKKLAKQAKLKRAKERKREEIPPATVRVAKSYPPSA